MKVGEAFREWDGLDYLAAGGMLISTGSMVAVLFPSLRKLRTLFPLAVGAAMIMTAAYGARRR
jgi:UDP-N-acetylmuramyl pentapeptide phosphotransferase/UDP-N-acetylglucosamine-1-phosphate transferase